MQAKHKFVLFSRLFQDGTNNVEQASNLSPFFTVVSQPAAAIAVLPIDLANSTLVFPHPPSLSAAGIYSLPISSSLLSSSLFLSADPNALLLTIDLANSRMVFPHLPSLNAAVFIISFFLLLSSFSLISECQEGIERARGEWENEEKGARRVGEGRGKDALSSGEEIYVIIRYNLFD
jgi:hypothetical protein